MKKLFAVILCALAVVCCKERKTPPSSLVDEIKSDLAKMQASLPQSNGDGLMITSVRYNDATNTVEWRFEATTPGRTQPTDEMLKDIKQMAITSIKYTPDEKRALDNGISFHFDYYSMEGAFLYSIDITPEDLEE